MAKKQQKANESYFFAGAVFLCVGMTLALVLDAMRLVGVPFILLGVVCIAQASGWIQTGKQKK